MSKRAREVGKEHIILDLRGMDLNRAYKIIQATKDYVFAYKIHTLVDKYGRNHFENMKPIKFIMDYKFHDTPDSVSERVLPYGGFYGITVHIAGGRAMLQAAMKTGLKVFAVTTLTSLSNEDIVDLYGGLSKEPPYPFMRQGVASGEFDPSELRKIMTRRTFQLGLKAGVKNFVCPGTMIGELIELYQSEGEGERFTFLIPGIRRPGAKTHDQRQVVSPVEVIRVCSGRHKLLLVLGREVMDQEDPIAAYGDYLEWLAGELEKVQAELKI